jgi:hypothetical protein
VAIVNLSRCAKHSQISRRAAIARRRGWKLVAANATFATFGAAGDYAIYQVSSSSGRLLLVAVWKSLENGDYLASCPCSQSPVLCHHIVLAAHDFFFFVALSVHNNNVARSNNRRARDRHHDHDHDHSLTPIFICIRLN